MKEKCVPTAALPKCAKHRAPNRPFATTRQASHSSLVALVATTAATAFALSITLFASTPAQACGGLFCSASSPVNQAAERIIFAFDEAKEEVTAVVEILYEGPSERFAWVLPVPGIPEVGVSSVHLLDRLQRTTNPQYNLRRDFSLQCLGDDDDDDDDDNDDNAEFDAGDDGAVTVLASGSAGPYDYEVIRVNPLLPDRAQVALDWLTGNNYDVTALGPDVLRPYLDGDMNLLAFRLSKNKSTGAIRPVRLTYESAAPMIPIRPTAVAANDDMGVLVWVLSSARAVPTNYKDLELNELLIDWFNPQSTYNDVVTAAADEAGGQGFVTEMAFSGDLTGNFPRDIVEVEKFRNEVDALPNEQIILRAIDQFTTVLPGRAALGTGAPARRGGLTAVDGLEDALRRNITFAAEVDMSDFLVRPQCYLAGQRNPANVFCEGRAAPPDTQAVDVSQLDREKLLRDLDELVMIPIEETVDLLADHDYLTRLYTTLSADEMTVDPVFQLNSDLPEVSNFHNVTLFYEAREDKICASIEGSWIASINGSVIRGNGSEWPLSVTQQEMPAVVRVRTRATQGVGTVDSNNSEAIQRAVITRFGTIEFPEDLSGINNMPDMPNTPETPDAPGADPAEVDDTDDDPEIASRGGGGGCSLAAGSASTSGLMLTLLSLLVVRRRRRR